MKNMTCKGTIGGSYTSFKEAKEECNANPFCAVIVDENCEGLVFSICENATSLEKDKSSCIHSKNKSMKSVIVKFYKIMRFLSIVFNIFSILRSLWKRSLS